MATTKGRIPPPPNRGTVPPWPLKRRGTPAVANYWTPPQLRLFHKPWPLCRVCGLCSRPAPLYWWMRPITPIRNFWPRNSCKILPLCWTGPWLPRLVKMDKTLIWHYPSLQHIYVECGLLDWRRVWITVSSPHRRYVIKRLFKLIGLCWFRTQKKPTKFQGFTKTRDSRKCQLHK